MVRSKKKSGEIIDPNFLLLSYSQGFFPMADPEDGEIGWYSPDPRAIIDLNKFKVNRSLRLTIKKRIFQIRIDTSFEDVIRKCADRTETWISEEIIQSYLLLHDMGYAHSVEAWKDSRLVGGLYGVAIGGAFFGESMFSLERDASKVTLVALVERLRLRGFRLLDIQFITDHLARFGGKEIPRAEYLNRLNDATPLKVSFI